MPYEWQNPLGPMEPRSYVCGYCGNRVGPNMGWWTKNTNPQARIYLCSFCGKPTFFDDVDPELKSHVLSFWSP